jgi:lipoyl(octanoyl) transferase
MSSGRSGVLVTFADPVGYSDAWALQQHFHAERLSGGREDTLMLLEHLAVYTAGRRTKRAHFNAARNAFDSVAIPVQTVSRGGSITYHGPGQLIAYPILALSQYATGPKGYVHMLEEVLIRTLGHWDIHGHRVAKAPGVWTRDRHGELKIASIGARIDRGITLHGVALNVSTDLLPFSRIVPCGLDGCRMTSMAEMGQAPVSMAMVIQQLAEDFSAVFQLQWAVRISGAVMAPASEPQSHLAESKGH